MPSRKRVAFIESAGEPESPIGISRNRRRAWCWSRRVIGAAARRLAPGLRPPSPGGRRSSTRPGHRGARTGIIGKLFARPAKMSIWMKFRGSKTSFRTIVSVKASSAGRKARWEAGDRTEKRARDIEKPQLRKEHDHDLTEQRMGRGAGRGAPKGPRKRIHDRSPGGGQPRQRRQEQRPDK